MSYSTKYITLERHIYTINLYKIKKSRKQVTINKI